MFKRILLMLLLVNGLDAQVQEELIKKSQDSQNKILQERDIYLESIIHDRGAATWYKTNNLIHISAATILAFLWYISRPIYCAESNPTTKVLEGQHERILSIMRALALGFSAITAPPSLFFLFMDLLNDYRVSRRINEFTERYEEVERNLPYLQGADFLAQAKRAQEEATAEAKKARQEAEKAKASADQVKDEAQKVKKEINKASSSAKATADKKDKHDL